MDPCLRQDLKCGCESFSLQLWGLHLLPHPLPTPILSSEIFRPKAPAQEQQIESEKLVVTTASMKTLELKLTTASPQESQESQ